MKKNVRNFLLVINSNLGPISHRLWNTDIYSLKPFSHNTFVTDDGRTNEQTDDNRANSSTVT